MRRQNLLRGYVDEENVRRNPITGAILNQNRGVPETLKCSQTMKGGRSIATPASTQAWMS